MDYQYREYFAQFYGPILFMIGIISVILGGLQVVVTVKGPDSVRNGSMLSVVAFWISIMIILCSFSIPVFLFFLFIYKIFKEWRYAIRDRLQHLEEGRQDSSEK